MKCALLLEKDEESRTQITRALKFLGYTVAPVKTPHEALNVAESIRFDLILTCTTEVPADRRALTGKLKRSVPNVAIVLIEEGMPCSRSYAGVNAVLRRPVSLEALRKTIDYRLDCELQPAVLPAPYERRNH